MKTRFKQDMHVLRWNARLVSTEPDDESRTFIVSFFCGDDTIQIYEVCDKNSGRIGGRFQERKRLNNPVTGTYFKEKEFKAGAALQLGGFKFMLMTCDDYTQHYMEENGDQFPEASASCVLRSIKQMAGSDPKKFCDGMLKEFDTDENGKLDFNELGAGLEKHGFNLSQAEVHVLMRIFDANQDGLIELEELERVLC